MLTPILNRGYTREPYKLIRFPCMTISIMKVKKGVVTLMNVRGIKKIITFVLLLLIIAVSNQFTLAYLLDKTSPVISKFIPVENNTNDLVISKLIEHKLGTDYIIPEDMIFEFQVELGEYYANQSITTSQGEFKTNEKGIFNLKIKPNVDVVISGIESGTKIKVTEIGEKQGFTIKDELTKEITISSSEGSKLEFINVYNPEIITGEKFELNGTKVLEGRNWQEGDKFAFKLEYLNESNEWISLGEKTIEYKDDNAEFNKYNFNEILKSFEFKNIGLYKFRLSEVLGNLENVDYDKTVNNFEILISDETMDGKLEIKEVTGYQNVKVTEKENKYNLEVTFNNKYIPVEEPEIKYEDEVENSILVNKNILVKETEYTIDSVINNFNGLSSDYTYVVYDKDNKVYEDELVRTGDYVIIKDKGNEYRFNLVLSGDTSGDGLITPLDYIKIKNHIIGNSNLSGEPYMLAADVSGDNNITPLDYIKVKNHIIQGGN